MKQNPNTYIYIYREVFVIYTHIVVPQRYVCDPSFRLSKCRAKNHLVPMTGCMLVEPLLGMCHNMGHPNHGVKGSFFFSRVGFKGNPPPSPKRKHEENKRTHLAAMHTVWRIPEEFL